MLDACSDIDAHALYRMEKNFATSADCFSNFASIPSKLLQTGAPARSSICIPLIISRGATDTGAGREEEETSVMTLLREGNKPAIST